MDREERLKLYTKLIHSAAVFAALVAVVLVLNYIQMQRQDPIESAVIASMVDRLSQDPNNEALKQEIRQLDLLARKAYFTSVWQVKTGAFILLFSGLFIGLMIKLRSDLSHKIEEPDRSPDQVIRSRKLAANWIWAIGSLIFVSALASAWLSANHLDHYEEFKIAQAQKQQESTQQDEIEVIDLSASNPEADDEITINQQNTDQTATDSTNISTPEPQTSTPEPRTSNSELRTSTPRTQHHDAFRGPNSNGLSPAKNLPVSWDPASGKNLIWKVQVPRSGYNSPVIWEDKLYLAGGDEALREVYCYNRHTGEQLWQRAADNIEGSPATPPKTTSDTGLSAPTVTANARGVFAIFGTGDLIAFDHEGNRLWARNMGVPDNHYGHSSSLVCHENKLIVLYDTNRGSKIFAVNCSDGSLTWEQVRNNKISWSSPVLAEIDGRMQILTTTDPYIAAHDLATGKELWSVECLMGEVGASACFGSGLVFGANEYARLVAVKPGETPEIVWENDEYLPEVASPVVSEGLLFIGTSYGVFACYDALTGEKYWEHDGMEGYYASPMIADGRVYAIDMSGTTRIFALSKDLQVIGEPQLGERAYATPAFADGRIYLRGEKSLYCIGEK